MLIRCLAALFTSFALVPTVEAQSECATWPAPGHETGLGGVIRAAVVFDDGSGPAWYVGGLFSDLPGFSGTRCVAKWDGGHWVPLPLFAYDGVDALAVWDDGSGPALYIGGGRVDWVEGSSTGVVRWNGTAIQRVGADVHGYVHAFALYDGGAGPRLFATGDFQHIGSLLTPGIAGWTGASWQGIGGLLGISVDGLDLAVHDDGSGPSLYVCGHFDSAGGVQCGGLARFNAGGWSALGAGPGSLTSNLAVHDFGAGPELVASALYQSASTLNLSRWNGASWTTIGAGIPWNPQSTGVRALTSFGTGAGAQLLAGGDFVAAGSSMCAWNGASWAPLAVAPSGGSVEVFVEHDDGQGPKLFVGGRFTTVGAMLSKNWAAWDGAQWSSPDPATGVSGTVVNAFCTRMEGGLPKLYVAGAFDGVATSPAESIASWDGANWTVVPGASDGEVRALTEFDDGAGARLYAGGTFSSIGDVGTLRRIARWNGSAWESLSEQPGLGSSPWSVSGMESFDDGSGAALFVRGSLPNVLFSDQSVLRWRNGEWVGLGSPAGTGGVMCVHDDGTGAALYVSHGSSSTRRLVRWDGAAWTFIAGDFTGGAPSLSALLSFDDGTGPALYVGGSFTAVSGLPAANVARWKDGVWSALGSGASSSVQSLVAHDDGRGLGTALFAGGAFGTAGGVPAHRIARYDGAAWSALGAGVSASISWMGSVKALASIDLGTGRDLFVGGSFDYADGQYATNFARWAGCGESGKTFCYGDGSATACPCGNSSAPSERAGCTNSLGTAGALRGRGEVSLLGDTFALDGSGMTNSSVLYFQAANLANAGAGVVFGDGLKCTNGPFVRLGTKVNTAGASTYPVAGDASISVKGLITAPGVKRYQARYRNVASFCTPEPFNYTNGVEVVWRL